MSVGNPTSISSITRHGRLCRLCWQVVCARWGVDVVGAVGPVPAPAVVIRQQPHVCFTCFTCFVRGFTRHYPRRFARRSPEHSSEHSLDASFDASSTCRDQAAYLTDTHQAAYPCFLSASYLNISFFRGSSSCKSTTLNHTHTSLPHLYSAIHTRASNQHLSTHTPTSNLLTRTHTACYCSLSRRQVFLISSLLDTLAPAACTTIVSLFSCICNHNHLRPNFLRSAFASSASSFRARYSPQSDAWLLDASLRRALSLPSYDALFAFAPSNFPSLPSPSRQTPFYLGRSGFVEESFVEDFGRAPISFTSHTSRQVLFIEMGVEDVWETTLYLFLPRLHLTFLLPTPLTHLSSFPPLALS